MDVVRALAELGADVDQAGSSGMTALMIASSSGQRGARGRRGGSGQVQTPCPSLTDSSTVALECGAVLLATGSAAGGFALARSLGHHVVGRYPSLFSFRLPPDDDDGTGINGGGGRSHSLLAGLAGVTLPSVELSIVSYGGGRGQEEEEQQTHPRHAQHGYPLLVTHRGVSGPAALRLSSFAAEELAACGYRGVLRLRPVAGLTLAHAREVLRAYATAHGSARVHGCGGGDGSDVAWGRRRRKGKARRGASSATHPSFGGALPRSFWDVLASRGTAGSAATVGAAIPAGTRWADCSKAQLEALAVTLAGGVRLPFRGKDANKEEFVTAGGVALGELRSMHCLESTRVPGLHFAGEMLDVDGVTGGFNFQACWTTGHNAGQAAARALLAE